MANSILSEHRQADDTLTITPLTGAIGARVDGVDLNRLTASQFADIRAAFLAHSMLVFRDQTISIEAHVAFAKRWGEIAVTPMATYIEGYEGVLQLYNRGKAQSVTENWHYDSTFLATPPALTILAAREMPAAGGDTMWSSQYLAYETLSDGMKRLLDGKRAKFQGLRLAKLYGHDGDVPYAYHPVVRTHPETGRKALFLGHPGDTVPHFEQMTEDESRPLLDFLYQHAVGPDKCYRHMWRAGDVVMWDNRCTMHYAVHDYGDRVRNLHRITIKGDAPF